MLNSCVTDTAHNANQQLTGMIIPRTQDNPGIVRPDLAPHLLRERGERQQVRPGAVEVLGHPRELLAQRVEDPVELGVHGRGVGLVVDRVQQRPHPRPGRLRGGSHQVRRVMGL